MATTSVDKPSTLPVSDIEERDGFVEYCKFRSCERMHVERIDELEEADLNAMRVVAIESKLEWREFTDEMKMFWVDRASISKTLSTWSIFLKDRNLSIPSVHPPESSASTTSASTSK